MADLGSKAQVYNQLREQYPNASEDELIERAGITDDEASNFVIDEIGSPETNPNYGRLETWEQRRIRETEPEPPAAVRTFDPVVETTTRVENGQEVTRTTVTQPPPQELSAEDLRREDQAREDQFSGVFSEEPVTFTTDAEPVTTPTIPQRSVSTVPVSQQRTSTTATDPVRSIAPADGATTTTRVENGPGVTRTETITTTGGTVRSGGETTTRTVIPAVKEDNAESLRLQSEVEAAEARKKEIFAEAKAEGKSFREVAQDPELQALNDEITQKKIAAEDAKTVVSPGRVEVTTTPGVEETDRAVTQESTTLADDNQDGERLDYDQTNPQISQSEQRGSAEPVGFTSREEVELDEEGNLVPTGRYEVVDADGNVVDVKNNQSEATAEATALTGDAAGQSEIGTTGAVNPINAPRAPGVTVVETTDGTFQVVDNETGEAVGDFLTEEEAVAFAEEQNAEAIGFATEPQPPAPSALETEEEEAAAAQAAATEKAKEQAALQQNREPDAPGDWRVKLRMANLATTLYKIEGQNDTGPGILAPLADTDGIVFPYTPRIDIEYSAEYNQYQPTHSNYANYFYKGSKVGEIIITADFTAQDTHEANYMLACIHFLKSASKMFYGQDVQRGSPPPLLFLTGLGDLQFKEAPCVISRFNYNLPDNVDYIRAQVGGIDGNVDTLQLNLRQRGSSVFSSALSPSINRLIGSQLNKGAEPDERLPEDIANLNSRDVTYVPTKITMSIVLLPVQNRQQVSNAFSLKEYANGNLIKRGFW